jgi:hypothetical protein
VRPLLVASALIVLVTVTSCGSGGSGGTSSTTGQTNGCIGSSDGACCEVEPNGATLVAGGNPIALKAIIVGFSLSRPVSWDLSGPGRIDPTSDVDASYTPPATVPAMTTASLTATAIEQGTGEIYTHHVTITITP